MKKVFFPIICVLAVPAILLIACSSESGHETRVTGAVWAKTATVLEGHSRFFGIATDSSNNIYASGSMSGSDSFYFSTTATAQAANSPKANPNALLVKYSSAGNAQFAKTVVAGNDESRFYAVALDSLGNIFCAGYVTGTDLYDFGNSQTITGQSTAENCMLVKYDSTGVAQWAASVTGSPNATLFNAVTVDSAGYVYATGYVGTGTYDFGNSQTVTVTGSDTFNAVLVKYDTYGVAQWVKAVSGDSTFYALAVDSSMNVYAAGYVGLGSFDFGNSVSATGVYASNAVAVKYDSAGNAVTVYQPTSADDFSQFYAIAVDALDNVYIAGSMGNGELTFNPAVNVTGFETKNALLVKFSNTAEAQWAKTAIGSSDSRFYSIFADTAGNIYAAGVLDKTCVFNFGNGITATGTSAANGFAVKYNTFGYAQWARTALGTDNSYFNAITEDSQGGVSVAGVLRTETFSFGNGVTAHGSDERNCVVIKYRQ